MFTNDKFLPLYTAHGVRERETNFREVQVEEKYWNFCFPELKDENNIKENAIENVIFKREVGAGDVSRQTTQQKKSQTTQVCAAVQGLYTPGFTV